MSATDTIETAESTGDRDELEAQFDGEFETDSGTPSRSRQAGCSSFGPGCDPTEPITD